MKNIRNKDPQSRLIFALDVGGELSEVISWVDLLKDHVGMFKVGKEAFTRFGPEIVFRIKEKGSQVFLDLKFHDIPHTVARAAQEAVNLGVAMFNIHASGGRQMIRETVAAVQQNATGTKRQIPLILAVTVLTSLNDDDLSDLGFNMGTDKLACHLACLARDAGASGVVASARDILAIREVCGKDFIIVTPGIRGASKILHDDQKRVLSAEEAIRLGADYLVVGRPIATAPDPRAAAEEFLEAIATNLRD